MVFREPGSLLTPRDHNPNEIHEEIIAPEVIWFWSAVIEAFVVEVEHAGSIIEDIAVDLTQGDHCL